jgi:lysylphosphatidylglycerol synthetase-like protein (DUF2156 family)
MKQPPTSLVRYSFFFTALVLTAFGVNSFLRVSPDPNLKAIYMVYAILMFGDALAMLLCGLFIGSKGRGIFWFAVTVLSLNIILTIFDQFGLIGLLFVMLNASTLGLLVNSRKEFLPQ